MNRYDDTSKGYSTLMCLKFHKNWEKCGLIIVIAAARMKCLPYTRTCKIIVVNKLNITSCVFTLLKFSVILLN